MIGSTKIFIDGGDPKETAKADALVKSHGHTGIDGQTTNPSLIVKGRMTNGHSGKKLSWDEAQMYYKQTVQEMAKVTRGPISIQVVGNPDTLTTEEMLTQARDRLLWTPKAVIKFPCTKEGLKAVEIFCQEGPVNVTIMFSQEQAAAAYAATRRRGVGADGKPYEVYVSPYVGRQDDTGEKGMDVVSNIVQMYQRMGDHHVQVLGASMRSIAHIHFALWLKADAITIPFSLLQTWAEAKFSLPPDDFMSDTPGLHDVTYRELSLDLDWTEYDIHHELTDAGFKKFWEDWQKIVE